MQTNYRFEVSIKQTSKDSFTKIRPVPSTTKSFEFYFILFVINHYRLSYQKNVLINLFLKYLKPYRINRKILSFVMCKPQYLSIAHDFLSQETQEVALEILFSRCR
jgi:hypothetical protein